MSQQSQDDSGWSDLSKMSQMAEQQTRNMLKLIEENRAALEKISSQDRIDGVKESVDSMMQSVNSQLEKTMGEISAHLDSINEVIQSNNAGAS
ncbi:hypothetical protein KIH87_14500 [Paraneptunicella aestuarii]|uniref:hypothetical protein n=1 Tax=Paraneptunicella aestuarii TaxID=2831148 RepID=UPI001E50CC11|nr:hypothetical protein [Paraneptunicella aestuarii]UAA37894.1 hypothetical protein KIH87_14500 [Paraneptunicella aestuarii]